MELRTPNAPRPPTPLNAMRRILFPCVLSMLHLAAFGQAGANDPTFNPGDVGFGAGLGATGRISANLVQPDGRIVIGGSFSHYNGAVRRNIAVLNVNGSLDTSFDPGTGANSFIETVALQPDGKIIIGGYFTSYNGTARNRIARLNADGSLDSGFDPGTGADNTIFTAAVQADGKIIIGGEFTSFNGTARSRVARLNSDGSLDTGFNPGSGVAGGTLVVRSIALQSDGKSIIAGQFYSYNGISRNGIARLNTNGSLDTGFNPGTGATGVIHSIVLQPDGKLVIGGRFTTYNGVVRSRIARLNANGGLDTGFDPGTGANSYVLSTALQPDGKIILGGEFTSYNGMGSKYIARLNANGSLDPGFTTGTGSSNHINTVAIQLDGKVTIGGIFNSYNGTPRNRFARLNADGTMDDGFNPSMGASSLIWTSTIQADGKIIIGGAFTSYNSTVRNRIARLNADGTLDAGFESGTGVDREVWACAVQADGKIIIGGFFFTCDGMPRNRIARLNADGGLDTSFDPGTGANGVVYSVAVQPDGKIIIGGGFTSYNGTGRSGIARLNADGSLDTGFDPGSGANSLVYTIALQPDGKILIGGDFHYYDGVPRNRLARLNTDGGLDTGFVPSGGANALIKSVTLQPDGKIILGGEFTIMNGVPRNRIARVSANGLLDSGFTPGAGANGIICTTALQPDGKVIIGGFFTSFNGISRSKIARLNANGTLDTGLQPGTGANGHIHNTSLQPDGGLIISCEFTSYNGIGRTRIARIFTLPAPDCNGVPGGAAYLDDCNTCVGGTTGLTPCDPDCNGDPGGTAYWDNCDVCVGGNTGLTPCPNDCNGDPGGSAVIDNCGVCTGGNTGQSACVQDCNGTWGGTAVVDPNCGLCYGGTTSVGPCVQDCNGEWGGTAFTDNCAQCVGGSTGLEACEQDCTGEWGGTAAVDPCGECAGGTTGITPCTPALDDYMSRVSGNWSTASTWLRYNGSAFVKASTAPNSGSGSITVRSGHSVQVSSAVSGDQLTVNSGGSILITAGNLTVADGAGTDLECAGSLILNGSGATLTANGTVNVGSGDFNWNNGTANGTGSVTIGEQGTAAFVGTNTKALSTTLTNNGAAIWSGGDMNGSGIFLNQADAVLDITFSSLSGLGVSLTNSGTVNYSGTSSFYTVSPSVFTNTATGVLNVNDGVWQFNNGLTNAGTLHIAAGKVMIMGGTVSLNAGTAITGTGEFRVSAGTTTLNTPLTNSSNYFWMVGGTWNATTGNAVTLQTGSSMAWWQGTLAGPGGFNIGSGVPLNMAGAGTRTLNTALTNSGTITWSNGTVNGSGALVNAVGGALDITFPSTEAHQVAVQNAGVLNYTGAGNWGTMSFTPAMTNSGTLNVNNGLWQFNSALLNSGTLHVAATRTLIINAATTLNPGTAITGTGEFRISGNTTTLNTPLTNSSNHFWMVNGTWNTTTGNAVTLQAGSSMAWWQGTLGGPAGFNIGSGVPLNMAGAGTRTLNTGLTNEGTITWSDGNLNGSGTLLNAAAGTLNITFASGSSQNVVLNNAGVLNYTNAGGWVTNGSPAMTNSGTMNVNNGSWQFNSGFTNSGTLQIAATKLMVMNSAVSLNAGTSITGTGEFRVSGGTTTLNAPLTSNSNYLWFYQGTLNTTAGNGVDLQTGSSMRWDQTTLGGPGGFVTGPGVSGLIAGTGSRNLNTPFSNAGTMNWSGGPINGSGSFANTSTGVLEITFTSPFGSDQNVAISNAGMLNYTGAGSWATSGSTPLMTNTGTFNINAGGWFFGGSPFTNSGLVQVATGCSLNIYGTPPALGGTVVNNGTVNGGISGFTGATFTNNGSVTLANLPMTGSLLQTLDGTGSINTLTINNANGVTLGGTQTINTNLALTNGKLDLGANSLLLGTSATLTGGGASSYCVAEGAGVLRRRVVNNATDVSFPVGTASSYLPVSVQLTAGSTADDFSVRAQGALSDEYDGNDQPTGGPLTQHVVGRTWVVDELVPGGSSATVRLQWNASDEGPLFTRSSCSVMRYDGADWSTSAFGASSGAGPYTRSLAGITDFSPFSVADDLAPLTSGIQLTARLFLDGPFDNTTNRMSDALRVGGLIPLGEPYTAMGYAHVGGGGETTSAPVLALTGDDAVVDWVIIELRDATTPTTVLATRSALVQRDGDVIAADGVSSLTFTQPAGTYHVAVRHRNHLGCMTLNPIAFSGGPTAVDFTTNAMSTFGTNARKPSTGAIVMQLLWAGDVTFDGVVKYTGASNDRDPILVTVGSSTPNNTVTNTYSTRDVNMNGQVKYTGNGNDRDAILTNVGSTTPNATRTEQLP